MKKRSSQKIVSIVLALAMQCSAVPAFAVTTPNAYRVNPVEKVNIFDTFSDYSCAYNQESQNYHPRGWYSGSELRIGNEKEEITGNNRVKMGIGSSWSNGSGSILYKMFGKTVTNGKLHASWDFKSDNTDVLELIVQQFTTNKEEDSAEDAYDPRQGSNERPLLAFRDSDPWSEKANIGTAKSPGKIVAYKSANDDVNADKGDMSMYSAKTYENGEWVKTDVFWDLDNKTYTVYVDGTMITNGSLEADGIKGIYPILEPGKYSDGTTVNDGSYSGTDDSNANAAFGYLDNFYAHEYTSENDSVSANVEYNAADDSEENYGVINIAFSEYMNKIIDSGDITVKDSKGDIVEIASLLESKTEAALMVSPKLSEDVYEISFGNNLKGTISGTAPEKVVISTKTSAVSDSESVYYYLNEDFNDYDGTYPVNWSFNEKTSNFGTKSAKFLTDGYTYKSYQDRASTATNALDGTTAFNMKGSTTESAPALNLWHWFPSDTPLTGDFTVEFDVYHENGGWNFGYVLKEDFDTAAAAHDGAVSGRNYQVLTAIPTGSTDNKLCFSQKGYNLENYNIISDAVVSPNVWHKVKIDVDTEARKFKVSVDNGTPIELTDPNYAKYQKGIAAIRLSRMTSSSTYTGNVAFDNVKVYKTGTYVMNEDFDTYPEGGLDAWSRAKNNIGPEKKSFWTAGGWNDPGWGIEWKPNNHAELFNGYSSMVRAYGDDGVNPRVVERAANCTSSGRMLSVAGYLWDKDWDSKERVPYTARLQKYFDRPIAKGKAFMIEMDMLLCYGNQTFGISLLEDSEMTPAKKGVASSTGNSTLDVPIHPKGNIVIASVGGEDLPAGNTSTGLYAPDTNASLDDTTIWATADRQFKYVDDGTTGTPSAYIPMEWQPMSHVSIKVEPYYAADGTAKAKITYTKEGHVLSVTTSQDFMTKSMVGIGIDYKGLLYASSADQRSALKIDDLRVYELDSSGNKITTSKTEQVESIKAVAVDGTESELMGVTNAVIPSNTMKIDVKFSAPVSDSIANERMVALMKEYADKMDYMSNVNGGYTTELSADKKTYSYYFNPGYLEEGTQYHLLVSNMVEFADNPLSQLDKDCRVAFTAGDKLKVNTFSTKVSSDDNLEIKINGYNGTPENKNIFAIIGNYAIEDGTERLITASIKTYNVNAYESFAIADFIKPEPAEGIMGCKAFVWEAETLLPLSKSINVSSH
ncbi:MAG: hypothetical protein PUE13_00555 [Clostridiales bacterium]|nr:hypothetical protein [Clostridiales bacterium]